MLDTLATPLAASALALCAYFCVTLKRDVRQNSSEPRGAASFAQRYVRRPRCAGGLSGEDG